MAREIVKFEFTPQDRTHIKNLTKAINGLARALKGQSSESRTKRLSEPAEDLTTESDYC